MAYDRNAAVAYAHQWAFSRNPKYYNFDKLGGDCTSFISQCLYAGSGVMNYTPNLGWYYSSLTNRSAAWAGVEFLHKFLINNKKKGPYAKEIPLSHAEIGDVIQLNFNGKNYGHSLLVVKVEKDNILITAHTDDSDNRPLDSYEYQKCRLLHIEGVRK